MKKAIATAVSAAILVFASGAQAASATYVTKGGEEITTGTDDFGASMQRGTSTVTLPDGSTRSEEWTCIGASNPPNSKVFDLHFVCDLKSDAGTYSINFGCQNLDENGLQGCVGGLVGKTGEYSGKMGATTWAGTGGNGNGTQHWLD